MHGSLSWSHRGSRNRFWVFRLRCRRRRLDCRTRGFGKSAFALPGTFSFCWCGFFDHFFRNNSRSFESSGFIRDAGTAGNLDNGVLGAFCKAGAAFGAVKALDYGGVAGLILDRSSGAELNAVTAADAFGRIDIKDGKGCADPGGTFLAAGVRLDLTWEGGEQ